MDEQKDEIMETAVTDSQSPAEKHDTAKKRSKKIYYVLLIIFSAVFLLSAVYLGSYLLDNYQSSQNYDQLASIRESILNNTSAPTEPTAPSETTPESSEEPTEETTVPTEPEAPKMLEELVPLYEINSDLIGYLKIPAAEVDLPVVQTPDRPNYYLRRDFVTKKKSTPGCLYAREVCDVLTPSDNVVIYGHAMRNETMFGQLYKFRDKSFWEENQYFTFDTLYERHTYQIFSVFVTSGTGGIGFPYHLFSHAMDAADFDRYVANVKGAAFTDDQPYLGKVLFDTGITPQYGDKLLCLSTCDKTFLDPDGKDNGRLVIMAVRVS